MSLQSSADELAKIILALDRCQHGRHSADRCDGCGGQSSGNLFLVPGHRIGTTMYGAPIVVPEDWAVRGIASYWLQKDDRQRYGRLAGPV